VNEDVCLFPTRWRKLSDCSLDIRRATTHEFMGETKKQNWFPVSSISSSPKWSSQTGGDSRCYRRTFRLRNRRNIDEVSSCFDFNCNSCSHVTPLRVMCKRSQSCISRETTTSTSYCKNNMVKMTQKQNKKACPPTNQCCVIGWFQERCPHSAL
jgi:hypothetical protein